MIKLIKKIQSEFEENHKIADNFFTVIILFVSLTSFFHVMEYWTLTNKTPFHIITAIATELFILGSMFAIRYTWVAWIPFIFGFIVQSVGNIFYSYVNITPDSPYFQAFMELFKPMFELMYGDELELLHYKRFLAFTNGLFYLSPIMFLWAKLELKKKVANMPKTPIVVEDDLIGKSIPTDNNDGDDEPVITPEPKDIGFDKPEEEIEVQPEVIQPEVIRPEVVENIEADVLDEQETISQPVKMSFDPVIEQERKKKLETPIQAIEEVPTEPTATEIWLDIIHEIADEEKERSNRKVKRTNLNPFKVGPQMNLMGLKPDAK